MQPALFDTNEFAIDAYYRFQVTPAIFVQPELQYIINPAGDDTTQDALIGGMRLGISF